MAQDQMEIRPTVTVMEATRPKVRSNLAITKEVHGKVIVMKCEDGGTAIVHRTGLIKPTLTLVESHAMGEGYEYTYSLKNAADAEAEVNQVVIWTGDIRPSIFHSREGVQPGQEVQFRIASPLPPGKGVKVSVAYTNHIKMAQERDPFLHLMEKPISQECRATIAANHDTRSWLTVDGPLKPVASE